MKTSKRVLAGFFSIALGLAVWTAPAGATALAPGDTTSPSSTVNLGPGGICGVNACVAAATTGTISFTGTNAAGQVRYSGTMTQQVFLNTTFDGVTGTSFLWTVTNGSTSLDKISRITVTDFGGFTVDVGYVGTDSGPAPLTADRSSSPGSVIGWQDWGGTLLGLAKGTTAKRFFIQTNAPTFDFNGSTNFLNGAISTVRTYNPAGLSVVPEPATLILFGSALAGIGLRGRRQRKVVA